MPNAKGSMNKGYSIPNAILKIVNSVSMSMHTTGSKTGQTDARGQAGVATIMRWIGTTRTKGMITIHGMVSIIRALRMIMM